MKVFIQGAIVILITTLLVACGSSTPEPTPAPTATPEPEPTATQVAQVEPTATAVVATEPTATEATVVDDAQGDDNPTAAPEPTATPEPTAAPDPAEAIVTSFTGPFETNGDPLTLFGKVLDVNGQPIPEAVVEIWQTDANGIYDHPGDRTTGGRDTTFQFYGSTTVDADGWYAFRTILPGEYEPRPRHIHYKVKQDGNTLLTSQFYFSEDIAKVEGEGMFQAVGDSGNLLLLQLVEGDNGALANGRIVIDTGIGGGDLPLTPSQAEGPFYPVVTVGDYDNDLTN